MDLLNEAHTLGDTPTPDDWALRRVVGTEPKTLSASLSARCIRPPRPIWALYHHAAGTGTFAEDQELASAETAASYAAARKDWLSRLPPHHSPVRSRSLKEWTRAQLTTGELPDVLRRNCIELYLMEHAIPPTAPYDPRATSRPVEERTAASTVDTPASWLLRCVDPDGYDEARGRAKASLASTCRDGSDPDWTATMACFEYWYAQRYQHDFADRFLLRDTDPLLARARLNRLLDPRSRRSKPSIIQSENRFFLLSPDGSLQPVEDAADLSETIWPWAEASGAFDFLADVRRTIPSGCQVYEEVQSQEA